MRRASRYLFICVLALTLAGCADQVAVPASTNSAAPSAVTENINLQTSSQQEIVVPEPASGEVGTVAGRIVSVTEKNGRKPITGLAVYLGTILKSDKGVEGLVELDKAKAPQAKLDDQGNFAIIDAPPGRYGLMLDTPQGAILLNTPESGAAMIVVVEGGKSLDLGELLYPIDIG